MNKPKNFVALKNGLRLSRAADGECKPIFSRKITSDEKDFLKVWLYFLVMWKLLFLGIFHLHTCEICLQDILTQGIRQINSSGQAAIFDVTKSNV